MSQPLSIVPKSAPPSQGDVLEVLQEVMDAAKAGNVSTVAVAWVDENRQIQTSWAHNDDLHLIACATQLQREIADDDGEEE
ncbi:MAG: hypothetical protein AB7J28_15840 [Hyphomonadaceae bacterium]